MSLNHRCLKKSACWILVTITAWCILLGVKVWQFGTHDAATQSDCIIILGAGVNGTTASPVFKERIQHAIHLYHSGYAPKLLFTGGFGEGEHYSEASVGRSNAVLNGVPPENILIEEQSKTTQQNLSEADVVMKNHKLKSAIIVSDPLHMMRATMMANDLGIHVVSSPTPTSRYRSLNTKLCFLFREIYFIHHYCIFGK